MLLTGWNMQDALVVAREEGTEDGIEIGEARGMERGREELLALWESGISLAEAKRKLNLSHRS
jgi:hypothetical protein